MADKMAFKSQVGKNEILRYYDAILEKLAAPYDRITVSTRHGDTFVIAVGEKNAPPLILLHGSSMNSAMWVGDIQKYRRRYRVYAPDIPGQPGRSDERQLPFTALAHSEWLFDVLSGLSLEKSIIIGASLGAWIAAQFAIANPHMVEKLVLLCPAGIGSQNKKFLFIALFHLLMGEKGIKKLMQKINGSEPVPETVLVYQRLIAKYFNNRKEPIPLFSDDELKKLAMPVFVFAGERDIMLNSAETASRIKSLLPESYVKIIPDAGHALPNLADTIINLF